MSLYFSQYSGLFIYFIICCILAFVFFGLSYVVATQNGDTEKLSAYECGFDPFDDARSTFDVRFYLVAILFIIFDLEVSFFISLVRGYKQFAIVCILVYVCIFVHLNYRFCI